MAGMEILISRKSHLFVKFILLFVAIATLPSCYSGDDDSAEGSGDASVDSSASGSGGVGGSGAGTGGIIIPGAGSGGTGEAGGGGAGEAGSGGTAGGGAGSAGIGGAPPTDGGTAGTGGNGSGFVGNWQIVRRTVDGSQSSSLCSSQLDLTLTTWNSYTVDSDPVCDCNMSGTMTVTVSQMVWAMTSSSGQYCGSPGGTFTVDFAVSADGNTLTLTYEEGASVVDVYQRIGGGTGGQDGGATEILSCDDTNLFVCVDFTDSGIPQAERTEFCVQSQGISSASPCSTDNMVGRCLMAGPSSQTVTYFFYSDTQVPFTPETAETNCTNMRGTWLP